MTSGQVKLYFQEGQREKVDALLARLKEQGVILVDNKGSPSISALFRWLVEEKLDELGGYDEDNHEKGVNQASK